MTQRFLSLGVMAFIILISVLQFCFGDLVKLYRMKEEYTVCELEDFTLLAHQLAVSFTFRPGSSVHIN